MITAKQAKERTKTECSILEAQFEHLLFKAMDNGKFTLIIPAHHINNDFENKLEYCGYKFSFVKTIDPIYNHYSISWEHA
jgi:hypothetical protein